MRTRGPSLLCLVALLAGCGQGSGRASGNPGESTSTTAVARSLQDRIADVGEDLSVYDGIVGGFSVAVAQDGKVATLVHGKAAHAPEETYMLASLSKPMVATAVLSLVASGELSLDDTVGDLLPGVLPRADDVTVEQLLSMQSGIRSYSSMERYEPDVLTSRQLVALVAEEPLAFEPGTRGSYVNTNYAVLDLVVQKVTGGSLAALLDSAVFRPAGMTDASLGGRPDVAGTTVDDEPYRPRPRAPSAAVGIVASAPEVAAFLEALSAGELIPDDLVQAMEADHTSVDFGHYGMGLTLEQFPCGTGYGHGGNNPGFETAAWTVPELGRTVVVLANASDVGAVESIAAHAICD